MKTIEKQFDVNAHIENVTCEIKTENGVAYAIIGFANLGCGDITAIKFNACGYNSFGDIVHINGKEKFFLIIQDIMVAQNEVITDLKAKLLNPDIKKLDLEECQICYADGSVVTYEGENVITVELEEFENEEELNALHKLHNAKAKFRPSDLEQGWICSCGRYNKKDSEVCSMCGVNRFDALKVCSNDGINLLVEEYRVSEERDREAREAEQERLKKERKKRNLKIAIIIVICIILAFLIGNAIILSGRTTYDSKEKMKDALQGTYTCYDGYSAEYMLSIEGNTITKRWVSLGSEYDLDVTVRKWNYKNGTIDAGGLGTFVITNTGDIKDDEDLYESGGNWSDKSTESASSSYNSESGYSALDICDLEWDSNSSYTVCVGKVKNTGTKTYYYVEVKGSFKDSSGNVLDTDWTYAVGSEGLAPGESSSFRLSVDKDYSITDCTVSILDFDN